MAVSKKIGKKYLFFKNKDDAKKRFPRAVLVEAFVGIDGWMWTTQTYARKYKLPMARQGRRLGGKG